MPRVVTFHISGSNPENLIPFYQGVFAWSFQKTGAPRPTWFITTGPGDAPGIDGILHTRERDSSVVNTIEVDNMDVFVSRIESAGGRIIERRTIPVAGKLALFEDPEHNVFQLRQPPSASDA